MSLQGKAIAENPVTERFMGPIDITVTDALKRSYQCATVQLISTTDPI
jgi:threonyl-tRNA synthetase